MVIRSVATVEQANWWDNMDSSKKKDYIARHPNSKYAKDAKAKGGKKEAKKPSQDADKEVRRLSQKEDSLMDAMRGAGSKKELDIIVDELNKTRQERKKAQQDKESRERPASSESPKAVKTKLKELRKKESDLWRPVAELDKKLKSGKLTPDQKKDLKKQRDEVYDRWNSVNRDFVDQMDEAKKDGVNVDDLW